MAALVNFDSKKKKGAGGLVRLFITWAETEVECVEGLEFRELNVSVATCPEERREECIYLVAGKIYNSTYIRYSTCSGRSQQQNNGSTTRSTFLDRDQKIFYNTWFIRLCFLPSWTSAVVCDPIIDAVRDCLSGSILIIRWVVVQHQASDCIASRASSIRIDFLLFVFIV